MGNEPRQLKELTKEESLRLLGSVSFGRVVFSQNALPAARPVNHLVDNGAVIIRTHLGAAVLSVVGQVVAYQADAMGLPRLRLTPDLTVSQAAAAVV